MTATMPTINHKHADTNVGLQDNVFNENTTCRCHHRASGSPDLSFHSEEKQHNSAFNRKMTLGEWQYCRRWQKAAGQGFRPLLKESHHSYTRRSGDEEKTHPKPSGDINGDLHRIPSTNHNCHCYHR
jgi:hypothetical protein